MGASTQTAVRSVVCGGARPVGVECVSVLRVLKEKRGERKAGGGE